jgi:polar amino acid transport system substrate-binding protein
VKFKFLRLNIAILFFILILFPSFAQEVTVVTENWEPYSFEENGHVIGMSTEIVEAALAEANIKIAHGKIDTFPWARAYRTAKTKKNVLIYMVLRTEERENLFHWVGPLVPSEKFFFFKNRHRQDVVLANIEDAKKFKIGALKSSNHEDFLLLNGFSKKMIESVSEQRFNLKKLLANRIDLIIDTDHSLMLKTNELGLPFKDFEKSLFLFEHEYYMAFSKETSSKLIQKVDMALKKLVKQGKVKEIIEKYRNMKKYRPIY